MKIKRVIEIDEKDLERIREIVERENKTALSVTTRGTAYITIADSKPYEERPQSECCGSCYLCDVADCGEDMRKGGKE